MCFHSDLVEVATFTLGIICAAMPLMKRPAASARIAPPVLKRPGSIGVPQQQQRDLPAQSTPTLPKHIDVPEWYGVADVEAQKQVFLVTAAKLVNEEDRVEKDMEQSPPSLKDPATISKREFRIALQDSIARPIYDRSRGGRPPSRQLEVDVYVGVVEGERGVMEEGRPLR